MHQNTYKLVRLKMRKEKTSNPRLLSFLAGDEKWRHNALNTYCHAHQIRVGVLVSSPERSMYIPVYWHVAANEWLKTSWSTLVWHWAFACLHIFMSKPVVKIVLNIQNIHCKNNKKCQIPKSKCCHRFLSFLVDLSQGQKSTTSCWLNILFSFFTATAVLSWCVWSSTGGLRWPNTKISTGSKFCRKEREKRRRSGVTSVSRWNIWIKHEKLMTPRSQRDWSCLREAVREKMKRWGEHLYHTTEQMRAGRLTPVSQGSLQSTAPLLSLGWNSTVPQQKTQRACLM